MLSAGSGGGGTSGFHIANIGILFETRCKSGGFFIDFIQFWLKRAVMKHDFGGNLRIVTFCHRFAFNPHSEAVDKDGDCNERRARTTFLLK